jgi:oligopeptide/dipeptide ABC transporter ATP-binding protein
LGKARGLTLRPFLTLEDVHASYPIVQGAFVRRIVARVRAVDGVSLTIDRGEAFGLVGESGCGKTSLARVVVRLLQPTSGRVLIEGRDVRSFRGVEGQRLRRRLQLVFQDPYDSLNGRMIVGDIVAEGLRIHRLAEGAALRQRVGELLEQVHLRADLARRYPRELSGGQRQRVAIARALAVEPELLVLDEPVSSLDVSVQAQILNLLGELREGRGLTYLFISHDLAVVRHLCDRTAVMYLGRIVELGSTEAVIANPLHPYTQALVSAVPEPEVEAAPQRILLQGDLPSPTSPPGGCPVHTRCPAAETICAHEVPLLEEKEPERTVACHFVVATPAGAVAPRLEPGRLLDNAERAPENRPSRS